MKYLSFDPSEFKELFLTKIKSLLLYSIIFTIQLLLVKQFTSNELNVQHLKSMIRIIISIVFIGIVVKINKAYLMDLIKKEKKVFFGVLSIKFKTEKSGKYLFNIDGNVFKIDQNTYNSFNVGDLLEVHVSARSRYLFKIKKYYLNDNKNTFT